MFNFLKKQKSPTPTDWDSEYIIKINKEKLAKEGLRSPEFIDGWLKKPNLRSVKEVLDKALILLLLEVKSEDVSSLDTWEIIKHFDLEQKLSQQEKGFLLSTNYDENLVIKYNWHVEAAYVLAWAIQIVEHLPSKNKIINVKNFSKTMLESYSKKDFIFRNSMDIMIEQDLNLRYLWNYRQDRIDGKVNNYNFNLSIVQERLHGLNWLIYSDSEWEDSLLVST